MAKNIVLETFGRNPVPHLEIMMTCCQILNVDDLKGTFQNLKNNALFLSLLG